MYMYMYIYMYMYMTNLLAVELSHQREHDTPCGTRVALKEIDEIGLVEDEHLAPRARQVGRWPAAA